MNARLNSSMNFPCRRTFSSSKEGRSPFSTGAGLAIVSGVSGIVMDSLPKISDGFGTGDRKDGRTNLFDIDHSRAADELQLKWLSPGANVRIPLVEGVTKKNIR